MIDTELVIRKIKLISDDLREILKLSRNLSPSTFPMATVRCSPRGAHGPAI